MAGWKFSLIVLCLALIVPQIMALESQAASKAKAEKVIAETVYKNGFVYTVDGLAQVVEAFAVKDGKFVAVGSNNDMKAVTGKDTKTVNLNGKMVMPGLADSHIHALRGALIKLGP